MTSTRCPEWTVAVAFSAVHAETGTVAACSKVRPAGFGTTLVALTVTYSANEPSAVPKTSSPGWRLGVGRRLVLLDHTTNGDVADLATPLSHAALVARHLTGEWVADPEMV
jgi:hypothetical protein